MEPTGAVTIVAIDEKSLTEVGRWPWSRDVMAELIDRLTEANVAAIGLDIVYAEPTDLSLIENLPDNLTGVDNGRWSEVRKELAAAADADTRLAEAIRRNGRVVMGYFFDFSPGAEAPAEDTARLSRYNIVRPSPSGQGETRIRRAGAPRTSIPILADAGAANAYFNVFPDPGDGTMRRIPLSLALEDGYAVPLSLALLQTAVRTPIKIRIANFGAEGIDVGRMASIPVAEDSSLQINFLGPSATIQHISATDILAGRIPPEQLEGSIILVGVTATGAGDVRVTPIDPVYPGVEIHATVIDNILSGNYLSQPKWLVIAELAAVAFLSITLGLALSFTSPVGGALLAAALTGGYVAGSQWIFLQHGYTLSVVYPVLAGLTCYVFVTLSRFVTERSEKQHIRAAFGSYISPEMVAILAENPDKLTLGGEKRYLSILFSDIRGFTTISEGLDPQSLTELINRYLTPMTDEVMQRKGTIDKYIGDAIMAFWNAPLDDDEHELHACQAALAMFERLEPLNQLLDEEAKAEGREHIWLRIGVGINSGECVVGNFGSDTRFDYSLLGDSVNLAARCESITKQYGVQIILAQSTFEKVPQLATMELDLVQVKGKTEPVMLHTLLGNEELARREDFQAFKQLFHEMIEAYRNREWDQAESLLATCKQAMPEGLVLDPVTKLNVLFEFYAERIGDCRSTPPPDGWRGEYIAMSK
jgi:adenylate cyclase